ncbi:MAG TPA: toll/interleukin-1 receptor domain-containing protein [Stellaceae bacterium]|nr:toll/interleukin-1 receptor domain-containing protein [Stellaceae bacterium]
MSNTHAQASIFISYASGDKPRINSVIEKLKAKDIIAEDDTIIYAEELFASGSNFREKIRKAIADASKVVVVWSKAGACSGWVGYETGMAAALEKPILMVIPKGEESRLPKDLGDVQTCELEYETKL